VPSGKVGQNTLIQKIHYFLWCAEYATVRILFSPEPYIFLINISNQIKVTKGIVENPLSNSKSQKEWLGYAIVMDQILKVRQKEEWEGSD
jgi:hypothetical protein